MNMLKGLVLFTCFFSVENTNVCIFRDYGIFITNIIPGGIADKNGRLRVGDRLMHVQSMVGNMFLKVELHLFFFDRKMAMICNLLNINMLLNQYDVHVMKVKQ